MSLETVYYVGQTVAVVAILVSLAFVGIQIRQNTRATRAAAHHAITDSFNAINSIIGTNPEAARIFRLGLESLANLNEDEQMSFAYLCLANMRILETLYYQKHIGTMEAQLFEAERRSIVWVAKGAGFRDWWRSNDISLSDEYRAYVDEIIVEAEKASG